MQESETAKILAKAALIDNRHIDRETIAAWHEIIGHLDFMTALGSLTIHRRTSSEYLMPAHIIGNVRRARDELAVETNRRRALDPPRPQPRTKMPDWFRDKLASFGKVPE